MTEAELKQLRWEARNPTAYPSAMDYAEHLERENMRLREALAEIVTGERSVARHRYIASMALSPNKEDK